MLDIRIHTRDGRTYRASECDTFLEHWQKFEPSEFLKNYLIRNLPVYCKEDGEEDETFKILKGVDGKVIWQEGDKEAMCEGLRYEVVETDGTMGEIEYYNPLVGLSQAVQTHVDRLLIKAYYEGFRAAASQRSVMNDEL
jgi:hypothetical protein